MSRKAPALWMLLVGGVLVLAGAALFGLSPAPASRDWGSVVAGVGLGLCVGGLLRRLLPDGCDSAPSALRRRYTREMVVAMLAYAVLLVISISALKHVDGTALRALLALLPVPPLVLVLRAIIRYIRDADEMQQRIELEAVSSATALVSLLYLTGGFLQLAKVINVPSGVAMIWVFPLVAFCYGLAKAVVARRYH